LLNFELERSSVGVKICKDGRAQSEQQQKNSNKEKKRKETQIPDHPKMNNNFNDSNSVSLLTKNIKEGAKKANDHN